MNFVLLATISSTLISVATAAILSVGCYSTEPINQDVMKFGFTHGTGITVARCVTFCQTKGHAYAGILAGADCYCGDEFGLTRAVTTCNFTCSDGTCGGPDAYDVYYVIDMAKNEKRKLMYSSEAMTFYEERRTCIRMDGDLVGRRIKDAAFMDQLKNLVPNANNASTKIWLGLRKREVAYEWVDEREPNAPNTYIKQRYEYANMWMPNDPGKKCVELDVTVGKLSSLDCSSKLNSVCSFLNESTPEKQVLKKLTQETKEESDDKTLALFIVLPLFLICYGGACILYCVHKIMKHCCKKGAYSQHVKLQRKLSSRPATAKKNAVYPEMPSQTAHMMLPMTAAEEKKLKLLENASREAKGRREAERVASGRDRPDVFDSRPVSTRSSGKLLPPMSSQRPEAPTSQVPVPGRSINEILRNKMEQQANKKKPKRIIST